MHELSARKQRAHPSIRWRFVLFEPEETTVGEDAERGDERSTAREDHPRDRHALSALASRRSCRLHMSDVVRDSSSGCP